MPQANLPSQMLMGVAAIDDSHQDFLNTLLEVSSASNKEFSSRYCAFVGKAERTFFTEEQWMEKMEFPLKLHREQHAKVLSALHHVHSRVMDGELIIGREVVEKLFPQWFFFHMLTMDAALASAMKGAGFKVTQNSSSSSNCYADEQLLQ